MRAEVSQAKREADFYRSNVEKSRKMLKRVKTDGSDEPAKLYEFRQKETDDVLRNKRVKNEETSSPADEAREQSRKSKKSKKAKIRDSSELAAQKGRKKKKSKKSSFESPSEPPSKKARTRSSDRREFLQSVFGAKS
jgi:hypothetical protein